MTLFTKWLVNIAALFVIILGLKATAPVITQVLVILFVAIVISPAYYFLRKRRFPSWLALTTIIVTMTVLCLYGLNIVLSKAVLDFAKKIPEYHTRLVLTSQELTGWLNQQDIAVPDTLFSGLHQIDGSKISNIVKLVGGAVGSFIKGMVLVLIVVSFILCELPSLPQKLRSQRWMTQSLWDKLSKIVLDVRHYMGIKTALSVATGFFVYLGLMVMGVDSPVLMGFLAFILNYVPVVGSTLAAVPAVMIALVQFDTMKGVYVAILYFVVNGIFGNILESHLMGYGFGVSPVIVLFSLVFWGWVLGPIGMLFAVPLTMAIRGSLGSMLREFDEENE